MQKREYLDLRKENGARFYYRPESLKKIKDELESFLTDVDEINTLGYAKKMMFAHEIQANNQVEGYGDDVTVIEETIKNASEIKDRERRARILNLYNAYKYILSEKKIDKETLKVLYSITSENALNLHDRTHMGKYYRTKPVYHYLNGRPVLRRYEDGTYEEDEGIQASRIDEFMDAYFEFLNKEINGSMTDEYIKSQILHFYFVYIHPYFDVNGRTSRTLSMWYLLNKKIYAYVIFNRGISFKGTKYDKRIIEAKTTNDLTYFLKLMLETVELELEKEYVIKAVSESTPSKLTPTDYRTLLYYLSLNGLRSVFDFASMYNHKNDKKRITDIYDEMIVPLLDKGIFDISRETSKEIAGMKNKVLVLRPLEIDKTKVQNLKL